MTRSGRALRWVLPLAVTAAVLFAAKVVAADSALYNTMLTPRVLQYVGALSKLLFLLLAALFALKSAQAFEADNPARPAWRLLWLGCLAFFLGQLSFAPYQLVLNQDPPFPSVADFFFMLAYPLFVAALFAFLRAYKEAGYPIGSAGARWATAAVVAVASAVVGYVILKPVAEAAAPAVEKALNVAYPVLDFVLLIPTVLLIRVALQLRGGALWKIWATLLGGFVFLCVGDILFAYMSGLGQAALDPLIHAVYILSYALLARGVLYQHELLTS